MVVVVVMYVATSLSCPPQILNMLLGPRFGYLSRMEGRFGILDCLKAKGASLVRLDPLDSSQGSDRLVIIKD